MARITALVENAGQVLTCAPDAPDLVGARTNTVVAVAGDAIAAIGAPDDIAAAHDLAGARRIDARGGLVMPGFVDRHTHLVFHRSRVEEYAQKVQGRTAAEIRAMGIPVGIGATARMMREASHEELVASAAERREAIARAVQQAAHTRDLIEAAGLPVPLVTGSGTGTLVNEAASGVYGELQAGSFLFMDADYARNERDPAQPAFEHALFVKTQVISVRDTHAVCDAGHKSHAIDSGLPTVAHLPADRALRYANGGDEHGILYAEGDKARLPALGRMLWLVPGHCDPTVNLYDFMIGVRGGLAQGVVERIIRVDARGALS